MGGANNICSDKTGTLTKNIMTVTDIWFGRNKKIENSDNEKYDEKTKKTFPAENFRSTQQFCSSDSAMKMLGESLSTNTSGTHTDASASEVAMMKFIMRCGFDYEDLRKKYIPKDFTRFVFDPVRKRMSTIIELDE